ncbi:unnamed protein product [Callosobruchus maculatus]|uniref:G-protein coupled receptors family 1 profile domain-containing protein n=1 Tax=Callosobruchus maculatus TaxID=64391 RepID=A0A653CTS9_CALMS|nr:unnamed protein product [Callosobruchus maculatus]
MLAELIVRPITTVTSNIIMLAELIVRPYILAKQYIGLTSIIFFHDLLTMITTVTSNIIMLAELIVRPYILEK